MKRIRCIAWDFDGVLNRGVVNGRFVWQDLLNEQFGICQDTFAKRVFGKSFWPVMRGEIDILEHLENWKSEVGYDGDVAEIMDFWFVEDAKPCRDMLGLMGRVQAAGLQQVIATNNETRRTGFIETEMGFADKVDAVFSSGRMKVAKPDEGYFRHIESALGLLPEQIILVDDYQENIDAAREFGWHAHHFPENGHDALSEWLRPIL